MKRYDKELKDRVIQEVKATGNITAVATKHGLPHNTAHYWVNSEKSTDKKEKSQELRRVQAELADTRLENEILKSLLKKTNLVWLKDSK